MKKIALVLAGMAMLGGSVVAMPGEASAANWHHGVHHGWRHHHMCRVVWKKKVIWRHHHREVVRYKVRVCR